MLYQLLLFTALILSHVASSYELNKVTLASWYKGLKPKSVVHAINCGYDKESMDILNITYSPDKWYKGGTVSYQGIYEQWLLPNNAILKTERYATNGENITYELPIEYDGIYTLILRFSEIYFEEIGQKVFDIYIGDTIVFKDFDILSEVYEKLLPCDKFLLLNVQNDKVFYEGQEMVNGMNDRQLQLRFVSGKADNPKINAIILVEGGLMNTHINNYNKYKEELYRITIDDNETTIINVTKPKKEYYSTRDNYFAEEDMFEIHHTSSILETILCCSYSSTLVSICLIMAFFYALSLAKDKHFQIKVTDKTE